MQEGQCAPLDGAVRGVYPCAGGMYLGGERRAFGGYRHANNVSQPGGYPI
jgi:hypothetical protein